MVPIHTARADTTIASRTAKVDGMTIHYLALWHFFFHGPTPEALVKGRERSTSSTSGTTLRQIPALGERGRSVPRS
jgi:hypothetical protein